MQTFTILTLFALIVTAIWAQDRLRKGQCPTILGVLTPTLVLSALCWVYADSPSVGRAGLHYLFAGVVLAAGPCLCLAIGLIRGRLCSPYPPKIRPMLFPPQ